MRRQLDAESASAAARERQLVVEMQRIEYRRHASCIGRRFFGNPHPLGRHFIRQEYVTPVKFLPGRASDAATPARIGLSLTPPTIGMLPCFASNSA